MRSILALALMLAVSAATPATAGPRYPAMGFAAPGFAPPGPAMQAQAMVPLDRVLPAVQRAVPGRVLDVQVVGGAYRVKVLTANGRVAHVLVDGRSGQVIRVE